MYVSAPDSDVYAVPRVQGNMPKKPVRCTKSEWDVIVTTLPPLDSPRAPYAKEERQAMKAFLIRHYGNRRAEADNFMLDFDEIYVLDSKTKSIHRAPVELALPQGRKRDRLDEVLVVRDDGTSFKIIPQEERKTPDDVLQEMQWDKTRETMENYLRGFRDYEKSNWF
eukprot:SM000077S21596  [mRNA]  locus=s77:415548:417022:+ [translate_table: standard]